MTSTAFAPGLTVEVRDEEWLITKVDQSTDGYRLKVRGLSDYVRDKQATFFTALDEVTIFDPTDVTVVADTSEKYRHSRLWVESVLRQTPVPLYQEELSVADRMLADPLDYQLQAVRHALSDDKLRPRVLIADAVGLGKTLEMGMILSELIRRGRGERILVVTPRHIMEQMQQEMWTRFAIPLVRLDSLGIQRVRQKLPASRNPFTYFPRVIVSMDTLKSPKYRAQLEKVNWDAVVIDEIHNATNVGTQNNQLARVLAPTTEALILASATPHNGDPESFKEILRLLDPTSVLPDGTIDKEATKRLIIRRHRNSDEVKSVVGAQWAERLEPRNILIDASDEENAVAQALHDEWLHNPTPFIKDRLFPWTLIKAFLSSPAALGETLAHRLKRLPAGSSPERAALERLATLNSAVAANNSQKYRSLVEYLQEIGIKKGSDTRVVVFSERVATLHWLQENLTKHLKLPKGAVEVMHGGLPDQEQMALVDSFKRKDSPIRVLVTGDVASEGVNLHAQCHHLVHYDIPWSLIRIQQRNGRIDRYGQQFSPEITTLLLDPKHVADIGELHVLERLIEREFQAHQLLGDASALMGKHSERLEEEAIRDVLRGERDFDATVQNPEDIAEGNTDGLDPADALLASLGFSFDEEDSPSHHETNAPANTGMSSATSSNSLYSSEMDFLRDALSEGFYGIPEHPVARGGVDLVEHSNGVTELTPPEDLRYRFDQLPQDYLVQRQVKNRLMLATTVDLGKSQLDQARNGTDGNSWPKAHFLGPLHPVSSWAIDRALSQMGRREIPAIQGDVEAPTVLVLGTLTNQRGQVISRSFVAYQDMFTSETFSDPTKWLVSIGMDKDAVNPGTLQVPADIADIVSEAVRHASDQLVPMLQSARNQASERIHEWRKRADRWDAASETDLFVSARRAKEAIKHERSLVSALEPKQQLIRPILVVLPKESQ